MDTEVLNKIQETLESLDQRLNKTKDRLTAIEITGQAHSVYFEDMTDYLIKTLGSTEEIKMKLEYMGNRLAKIESKLEEKGI